MALATQDVINSRLGVGFALGLGRLTPPRLGHRLSDLIADRVSARRGWNLVRAVRANQWVVGGANLSTDALDRTVRHTFHHTARCLYDYYHNLNDRSAMDSLVAFEPDVDRLLTAMSQRETTGILVGPHMSNFDFVARAIALKGVRLMALSFSQPGSGYRWQNQLRQECGIDVSPASMGSLLRATRRLRAGDAVITGLDRPLPGSRYQPRFFGRPAPLSAMHVFLALKTNVPVYVLAAVMRPDGIYQIKGSEAIHMVPRPDRHAQVVHNAERVLAVAEDFIRLAPYQWSMFYPVWPEALEEMP
ncbi:MAG: lysophospholipid acyltransferase family protein [Chloroflexota bacterium]|nr:lysophospholipid acyltransferase family protein [Chloroflexota bacterium]